MEASKDLDLKFLESLDDKYAEAVTNHFQKLVPVGFTLLTYKTGKREVVVYKDGGNEAFTICESVVTIKDFHSKEIYDLAFECVKHLKSLTRNVLKMKGMLK